MNIGQFFLSYSTEESCIQYFRESREAQGIACPKCTHTKHYWKSDKLSWQCKRCSHRVSLRKGTVMENSNLPFRLWLWCLYLTALTKKGYSTLELQRLLQHKRYEPIWLMMHKIRICMGKRDATYKLTDFVEMDEGFFEGHRQKEDEQNPKEIKEVHRNVKTIVAVSTNPILRKDQVKGKPNTYPKFLKMAVVDKLAKDDIEFETTNMLSPSSTVMTDGKRSYSPLKKITQEHIVQIVKDKTTVCKAFPWVHTAISNARKKILGLHHQVENDYMQNYLSEFAYKFNRRNLGRKLFERLVIACTVTTWRV